MCSAIPTRFAPSAGRVVKCAGSCSAPTPMFSPTLSSYSQKSWKTKEIRLRSESTR